MIDLKGSQFERDIVLWGVRWYVAYPISYRQLEEMMVESGVEVDLSSLNRCVRGYVPLLQEVFRQRSRAVGNSWRMDETFIKARGHWKYPYRAVNEVDRTSDFVLTAKRDRKAAGRFLPQAIDQCGTPAKINSDKSGVNAAAIGHYDAEHDISIELRQVDNLNNVVVQDHRAIKRMTCPMLGVESFRLAAFTMSGVELMHMMRKGSLRCGSRLTPAQQFYSLAA